MCHVSLSCFDLDTGNLKHRIQDHAAMSLDFKGEAVTFKATTAGILANLSHCIELMHQRDESWKRKLDKEIEKKKKINEAYTNLLKEKANITVINGPDFEVYLIMSMSSIIIIIVIIKEGPHSQIKEEQFFDAIDNTLDNLELEEERVRNSFLI
jgi:collagen type IV alpha-3-binding protein